MLEPLPPRYTTARLLGEGSFGAVYAAHDRLLERPVAVKLLRPQLATDTTARRRFEHEVRTAALAGVHPHVVTVHDTGEWLGLPYFVMELLDGHVHAGVSERLALRWLAQAAAALDFVHAAGIVHRDVKPANLLLDAYGDLRLADFGVAYGGTREALTATGAVVGTPGYVAPEVAGGAAATAASDRYSLGVVARELLGDRPALAAALAPSPADRPATAAALVAMLGADEELTRVLPPGAQTAIAIARIPRTRVAPRVMAPLSVRRRRASRGVGVVALAAVAAAAAAGGAVFAGRLGAAGPPKRAASSPPPQQTCALSPFHHNANVVISGLAAVRFCRTQAHVLQLQGDQWTYRAGAELFAPDTGSGSLQTICVLRRGRSRLHVYDSGSHTIGSDLCHWYTGGGWRRA
jgi:serine/threonine protein kinase